MKAGHQGISPTALPGMDGGWMNAASPPAAVAGPVAGNRNDQPNNQQNSSGGLDSWLLDKLFGQR